MTARPVDGRPLGPVAVIGLGLIGGSLARDLAAEGVAITGVDTDPSILEAARSAGAIRRGLPPDAPLPPDIGVVVLAAPVPAIPALLRLLAATGSLGAEVVVTDVASTKRSVLAGAAAAGVADRFVGGHPMAGDHRRGWAASRRGLFQGARVWLCPGSATETALEAVHSLWRRVGAETEVIDPEVHDRLVARTSHLPQAVASALAGALADQGIDVARLGPGGRDTTRLAGSDPDLWTGILLDNADEVAAALRALGDRLAELDRLLRDRDAAGLRRWLAHAAHWR